MAQIIIIASIHQPSTTTFRLFDKLLLLSGGRTCYNGPVSNVDGYLERVGYPIPAHTNPAEFLLDICSADFGGKNDSSHDPVQDLQSAWKNSPEAENLEREISQRIGSERENKVVAKDQLKRPHFLRIVLTILHRLFIKSYRDVVAYGIRIVMYLGMYNRLSARVMLTNCCSIVDSLWNGMAASKYRSAVHPAIYQLYCRLSRLDLHPMLTNSSSDRPLCLLWP